MVELHMASTCTEGEWFPSVRQEKEWEKPDLADEKNGTVEQIASIRGLILASGP